MSGPITTFRRATDEERLYCWKRNSESWSKPLPLDSYLSREVHLGEQLLTRNGGISYWVLTVRDTPDAKERVVSGCESIRKIAVLKRGDKVEEVQGYGVCSVFTPKENRGEGYATKMLEGLAKWYDGEGKAKFSVLWSDVGKEFYARNGWMPYPSLELGLPVSENKDGIYETVPGVETLFADELEGLCEKDIKDMRMRVEKGSGDALAILPTYEHALWHFANVDFAAKVLKGSKPERKGAKVGKVWGYWRHDWTSNTLMFLRLVVLEEDPAIAANAIRAVLKQAEREASVWGLKEVVLWSAGDEIVSAARGVEGWENVAARERETSIPCLRLCCSEDVKGLEWVGNEKYCWC